MRHYKPPKTCSIEKCFMDVQSNGLCSNHYRRQREYDDPLYQVPLGLTSSNKGEFDIWVGMRRRCYYPGMTGYEHYGGRGITVCDRWLGTDGFKNFLEDMGKRPDDNYTIEREDSDGNYEPANCRWATWNEQAVNRSNNTSHIGVHQTKSGWLAQMVVRGEVVLRKHYPTFEAAMSARKEAEAKMLKTRLSQ